MLRLYCSLARSAFSASRRASMPRWMARNKPVNSASAAARVLRSDINVVRRSFAVAACRAASS